MASVSLLTPNITSSTLTRACPVFKLSWEQKTDHCLLVPDSSNSQKVHSQIKPKPGPF